MDYVKQFETLLKQKEEIEIQLKQTVIDWVSSKGIKEGDKFILKTGYYAGKTCLMLKDNTYVILKKDGTRNYQLGMREFWYGDLQRTKIEKV